MINYADYFRKDGTQDRELIEMLNRTYQQGRADATNWIDLKEKQPSFCETVLTINNNNIQRVLTYGTDEWSKYNEGAGFGGACITHWMSLPKPPEKEQENEEDKEMS